MPWPAILLALSFATGFAWLVLAQGWQPWIAFLIVGGGAFTLAFAMVLLAMCFADDRTAVWNSFKIMVSENLGRLLRHKP